MDFVQSSRQRQRHRFEEDQGNDRAPRRADSRPQPSHAQAARAGLKRSNWSPGFYRRIITTVTRDEALRRLHEHRAELRDLGVRSLDLFGSVARGDARPGSDIDLLVAFDRPVGLFHFFRVQRRLAELLGCAVDLVMKDAVKSQLRTRILAEAVSAS
jgi:predicted nucleotidyltransferase